MEMQKYLCRHLAQFEETPEDYLNEIKRLSRILSGMEKDFRSKWFYCNTCGVYDKRDNIFKRDESNITTEYCPNCLNPQHSYIKEKD